MDVPHWLSIRAYVVAIIRLFISKKLTWEGPMPNGMRARMMRRYARIEITAIFIATLIVILGARYGTK